MSITFPLTCILFTSRLILMQEKLKNKMQVIMNITRKTDREYIACSALMEREKKYACMFETTTETFQSF